MGAGRDGRFGGGEGGAVAGLLEGGLEVPRVGEEGVVFGAGHFFVGSWRVGGEGEAVGEAEGGAAGGADYDGVGGGVFVVELAGGADWAADEVGEGGDGVIEGVGEVADVLLVVLRLEGCVRTSVGWLTLRGSRRQRILRFLGGSGSGCTLGMSRCPLSTLWNSSASSCVLVGTEDRCQIDICNH